MWDLLLAGCGDILNPQVLGIMVVGTVFGIIGGATPGISGAMTLALFLQYPLDLTRLLPWLS